MFNKNFPNLYNFSYYNHNNNDIFPCFYKDEILYDNNILNDVNFENAFEKVFQPYSTGQEDEENSSSSINEDVYLVKTKSPINENILNNNVLPVNFSNLVINKNHEKGIIQNNNIINRTTAEQTSVRPIIVKKEKIFINIKVHRNVGRRPKNSNNNSNENVGKGKVHTKYNDGNIKAKITKKAKNNYIEHLNKRLKQSKNPTLNSLTLLDISGNVLNVHKKEENLKILKMPMKDLLSNEISLRYKNINIYHNKKVIKKILEQNDKVFNSLLNITFEEVLKIYGCETKKEFFEDFRTINDEIDELNKQGKEYAKLYISFLRNFKNKIEEKNGRETNNEKGKVKMKYEVKMEARRKLWENDE